LATGLKDIWGHPERPANFTLPAGIHGGVKLGHDGEHIFKTTMSGVGGTPMPPFAGQLKPQEVWDIVHYVQSLRVQAHASELISAGLKDKDREEAVARIWASLSETAAHNQLDQAVIRQQLAKFKEKDFRIATSRMWDNPGD